MLSIFSKNLLVLALHAMACVAGFIAGSSIPIQAAHKRGMSRRAHDIARRFALCAIVGATTFSLCWQAYLLGRTTGEVAFSLGRSAGLLLLGLLPHALPELMALFLPLAAWIGASRRGEWDAAARGGGGDGCDRGAGADRHRHMGGLCRAARAQRPARLLML